MYGIQPTILTRSAAGSCSRRRYIQTVVSWALVVFFVLNVLTFLQQESQTLPEAVILMDARSTSVSSNSSHEGQVLSVAAAQTHIELKPADTAASERDSEVANVRSSAEAANAISSAEATNVRSSAEATNVRSSETQRDTQNCSSTDIPCIRRFIAHTNKIQRILNSAKFELSSDDSTIAIVVQVHNRTDYLRHLVNSLRQVEGISNALLILSHDFYSVEVNDIAASIDFCLVSQYAQFACCKQG